MMNLFNGKKRTRTDALGQPPSLPGGMDEDKT